MQFIALLQASPDFLAACVFLFGLCIGSFLNVVISRLPKMMELTWRTECAELLEDESLRPEEHINLIKPNSHCPECKTPIRPWQNIPLVSYILLRGRCSNCGTRISLLYPTVELATGLLSVAIVYNFGWSWQTAAALLLTWSLVPLAVIDLQHQLLPDDITLPTLWFGLLLSLTGLFSNPVDSILGAVIGYTSLWGIYQAFKLITGKEGMGFGDFKLFALFGAWFGWQSLPLIVLLSSVAGALTATAMLLLRKLPEDRAIPFGPFLAGAGWITMIAGDDMIAWYWSISGI